MDTNPALQDLAVLVGEWQIELTNAKFLDAGTSMTGKLSVSWFEDSFLVLRSSMDAAGPPRSVAVIGRNETLADYELLYADERGVSRIYRMSFDHGKWVQHREDPGFHQRFEGTVTPEGDRISAYWEKSHDDGATWEHDFDLIYRRLDA